MPAKSEFVSVDETFLRMAIVKLDILLVSTNKNNIDLDRASSDLRLIHCLQFLAHA